MPVSVHSGTKVPLTLIPRGLFAINGMYPAEAQRAVLFQCKVGDTRQQRLSAGSYLGNVEILSEKRCLLRGNLPALVGQDLTEGQQSVLRLSQGEGLPPNREVDVVLGQRPAPVFVHLHGLTVTAQRVPPLNGTQRRADEGDTHTESGRRVGPAGSGKSYAFACLPAPLCCNDDRPGSYGRQTCAPWGYAYG